jgi:hypothetical protein
MVVKVPASNPMAVTKVMAGMGVEMQLNGLILL